MKRLLAISLLVTTSWVPVAGQQMSPGENEFVNSCAVCHGRSGKGDGPLAKELRKAPADLTRLSERNGGKFPDRWVSAMIDGRYIVPGHGERDMPVWGRRFLGNDRRTYGPRGEEAMTQERIHQLAAYLETLQR